MIDFEYKRTYSFQDLVEITRILRAPGGCPWDREQTHTSIRRNFLEEACEAVEAIDEGSAEHLREELGDVLLQVTLHAQMEEEAGRFDIGGVADGICKKLIYRHPHVFGDVAVSGSSEVLQNWEALKRVEKGQTTHADSVDAVARTLPGLWRAEKMQSKAKKTGFDWPDISGALDKLSEEVQELRAAVGESSNTEEELGDVLFSAVNVARFLHLDPETALAKASDKFARRFRRMEELAAEAGRTLEGMTLLEMDTLWNEVKKQET